MLDAVPPQMASKGSSLNETAEVFVTSRLKRSPSASASFVKILAS